MDRFPLEADLELDWLEKDMAAQAAWIEAELARDVVGEMEAQLEADEAAMAADWLRLEAEMGWTRP